MKLHSAAVALLGLPAALASVAPLRPHSEQTANPTPTASLRDDTYWQAEKQRAADLLRWQARNANAQGGGAPATTATVPSLSSTSGSASAFTVHNTFTNLASGSSSSASASASSMSASASASSVSMSSVPVSALPTASVTAIAVFTAPGEVLYTVTSIASSEFVNGRVLTPGGAAQLIGGVNVAQATNGKLVADGQTIKFETYTPSSSEAPYVPQRGSSTYPGNSASSSASASGAASGNAAAAVTGLPVVGAMAAVGAVVGAIVL